MPRRTVKDPVQAAVANADELCIEFINEHAVPGLAVGIVHDGELVYAKGFGAADSAKGRPVTPDTVFRIGSISKTFTAIGLMRLWEQGAFQLDDPVNNHLKGFRVQHPDPTVEPVTFRHMLTHTSGIGELRSVSDLLRWPMAALGAKEDAPLPALRDYYAPVLRAEVPPGEKWAYANHAFAVLGQLVEDISGEPFAHYMIRNVFEPLGMHRTDYLKSERVRGQLAQGYRIRRGVPSPAKFTEIVPAPAGSVFSSVNEMALYLAALMNGGSNAHGTVLKPETLQTMMTPHYQVDERLPAVGLAFMLDRFGPHPVAGHTGGWTGFISGLLVAPESNVGVVVFTNSSRPAPQLTTRLMHALLGEAEPEVAVPGIAEQPHLWPELTGVYGPRPGPLTNARLILGFGGEIAVTGRRNHLEIAVPSWLPVQRMHLHAADPKDPLSFRTRAQGTVTSVLFRKDGAGRVDSICIGGFITLYRRSGPDTLKNKVRAGAAVAALAGARRIRKRRRSS